MCFKYVRLLCQIFLNNDWEMGKEKKGVEMFRTDTEKTLGKLLPLQINKHLCHAFLWYCNNSQKLINDEGILSLGSIIIAIAVLH